MGTLGALYSEKYGIKKMTNVANSDNSILGGRSLNVDNLFQVSGVIKWFDHKKGYGFISLSIGGDAFIHVNGTHLRDTSDLVEGAEVIVDLEMGDRGYRVSYVHTVNLPHDLRFSNGNHHRQDNRPDNRPDGPRHSRNNNRSSSPHRPNGRVGAGRVKWFNVRKGFGFIVADGHVDDEDDIFFHISAFKDVPDDFLDTGDRVSFVTSIGRNGKKQADIVKLLEPAGD